MHKVEGLKIWNKAIGLVSQIKRNTISISSNIAEGVGRNSKKEFKHFLSIANGSCYKLQTQLILTIALDLIQKEKIQPLIEGCIEIQKMNYSFQKTLSNIELTTQY